MLLLLKPYAQIFFCKLTSNIYECFCITFTEFVYANGKNAQFSFMEGGLMASMVAYIAMAGITVLGICHCTKFLLFQKG